MRHLTLLTALISLSVATAPAQSVDQLRQSFDQRCEQAATSRDDQLGKLNQSYQAALERLLEKTKSAGNLDAALPIHQELDALKQATATLPVLPDNAGELKPMRTKYLDTRQQILKTHATALIGLADKMETALKAREAELTKAGKIADAIAARESREELAKNPDVRSARDLLMLGGAGGKGRAALQLRRYGDNLEVLVFHDRLGKISMDSPVENVREKTGDGKELGNTKAKVLGEFVGAKGYTVDTYVAYNQVFDGKDPENFGLVDLIAEFRYEVEKQNGVRISPKAGAKTPYIIWQGLLPPIGSKGSYRISVRYYIPERNRIIAGFLLGNEAGHVQGEKKLMAKGRWVDEEIAGESTCDKPNLALLPVAAEQKSFADNKDDYIVLGKLEVEHVRFSAYQTQKLGVNGEIVETNPDPLKQPLYVTNGEFAPK